MTHPALIAVGLAAVWLLWANRAQAADNWILDQTGKRMETSMAGLSLIKRAEGFSARPYKDAAGLWTIGYGHRLRDGEWYEQIDDAGAVALLAADVAEAENAINSLVKVTLNQGQFDALVSFAYNVGVGAFRRSTLLERINAGDAGAAEEFSRWVYADGSRLPGLVTRRANEARLFTEGIA